MINKNNQPITLYVSRGFLFSCSLIGMATLCFVDYIFGYNIYDYLYSYYYNFPGMFLIHFPGLFLIISSFLLFCRKITIVNKDAKFKGVFKRKSIKDVESIDCSGFWIFNSVSIYGRGGNKISLSFVADFNNVRDYAENIERWN
jgi:hypothetical protein